MRRLGILAALVLASCSRRTPVADSQPAPAASTVTSAAPVPQKFRYEKTAVLFQEGDLARCVDVIKETPHPVEGEPLPRFVELWKKAGMTRVEKPCSESFGSRTVLASCDTEKSGENDAGPFEITMHEEYFRYTDVGLSDEAMKGCLERGGTWKPLDPKSREWREAKREHAGKNLRKLSEKLNAANED